MLVRLRCSACPAVFFKQGGFSFKTFGDDPFRVLTNPVAPGFRTTHEIPIRHFPPLLRDLPVPHATTAHNIHHLFRAFFTGRLCYTSFLHRLFTFFPGTPRTTPQQHSQQIKDAFRRRPRKYLPLLLGVLTRQFSARALSPLHFFLRRQPDAAKIAPLMAEFFPGLPATLLFASNPGLTPHLETSGLRFADFHCPFFCLTGVPLFLPSPFPTHFEHTRSRQASFFAAPIRCSHRNDPPDSIAGPCGALSEAHALGTAIFCTG